MFKDRKDAGQQLAYVLKDYKDRDALVLAIPRGGVEVGFEVAKHLDADFSITITRKLPFPHQPEAGFGAIAEDGSVFIFEDATRWMNKAQILKIIDQQKKEIKRRINLLRKVKPLPSIIDRCIVLVDDGIAMGSTMRASIELCRKQKARKIVVASPVAGKEQTEQISKIADDVVILEIPTFFQAVAQVYFNWYDVSDQEVIDILDRWNRFVRSETK